MNKNILNLLTKKPTFTHSMRQLWHSKTRKIMLLGSTVVFIICCQNATEIAKIFPSIMTDNVIVKNIPILPKNIVVYIIFTIIYTIILLLILADTTSDKYEENLRKAGIINRVKDAPIFIRERQAKKNPEMIVLEFDPNGTDLELWESKKNALSNTLKNHRIGSITQDSKRICVYLQDGNFTDRRPIYWRKSLLSGDSSKIVLGIDESFEEVILDLNANYHVKIGGASGSGKTMLQQLIVAQLLQHGDTDVYIADLKGWDYTGLWRELENCTIVRDIPDTYDLINKVRKIADDRDRQLRNVKDLSGRSQLYNDWRRIVIIIEEATDLFLRPTSLKNLSSDEKERYQKMQDSLEFIARKGRACKLDLFINTQRPDAEILPKDLTSNLDYVICGKADPILSRVVLGNTDAHEKIPKNRAGFFVNNNGVLFQAYLLDLEEFLKDCPKKQ